MQYATLSFEGGASAKGGGARAVPKSNQDDMVTYSTVETKENMQLLSKEERNTSASPEAPVTSMV